MHGHGPSPAAARLAVRHPIILLLWESTCARAVCNCSFASRQGLAFIFTAKGGLGLSYETGWGCVVQRLGKRAADGNGAPLWSGPSFVRINNVGLGLTVGAAPNCGSDK